jgi:hypothetical protein
MNNNWFEVKVKYTKQLDNGTFKRVSEPYLISAMSFSDAESRAYEEVGSFVRGEFVITAIKRENIHDIFQYEDADVWYKTTIAFQSESDESEKSKVVKQTLLTTAHSVKQATERINESLSGMMLDYTIKGTVESALVDVFPFNNEEAAGVTFSASYTEGVPGLFATQADKILEDNE